MKPHLTLTENFNYIFVLIVLTPGRIKVEIWVIGRIKFFIYRMFLCELKNITINKQIINRLNLNTMTLSL